MAEKKSDEPTEIRYGVPADLFPLWREAQRRIGLPQTQILNRLVRFFLAQDEVAQMLLLGTLTPRSDLLELVLRKPLRPSAVQADRPRPIAVNGVTIPGSADELGPAPAPPRRPGGRGKHPGKSR